METKVMLTDGTTHIISGRPEDYMQLVAGVGKSDHSGVVAKSGRQIEMSEIVTMQLNK